MFTISGGTHNALKVTSAKKKTTVYSNNPIHPKLREQLLSYKKHVLDEMLEPSIWLFPCARIRVTHIKRIRAHNILAKAFDDLAIDGASTHSMRRTCRTKMSRAGVPLRTI